MVCEGADGFGQSDHVKNGDRINLHIQHLGLDPIFHFIGFMFLPVQRMDNSLDEFALFIRKIRKIFPGFRHHVAHLLHRIHDGIYE